MFFSGLHKNVIVKFLQRDIDKFKENVRQTKIQKRFIYGEKEKHGTEGNELKCHLL